MNGRPDGVTWELGALLVAGVVRSHGELPVFPSAPAPSVDSFHRKPRRHDYMSKTTEPPIRTWPLKEKPRQVTRDELKRMTPAAINMAREQGALEDIMGGKKPEPEVPQ
jgi:hypothetical protein